MCANSSITVCDERAGASPSPCLLQGCLLHTHIHNWLNGCTSANGGIKLSDSLDLQDKREWITDSLWLNPFICVSLEFQEQRLLNQKVEISVLVCLCCLREQWPEKYWLLLYYFKLTGLCDHSFLLLSGFTVLIIKKEFILSDLVIWKCQSWENMTYKQCHFLSHVFSP